MNLLNKLEKRDKMRGLSSILSLFGNEFNKFNNTGALMLDSIYHMTYQLFCNCTFGVKTSIFCQIHVYAMLLCASFHNVTKICKPLVVY